VARHSVLNSRRRRGAQLETAPALWQQRLDRAYRPFHRLVRQREVNQRQAAHTALSRWHTTTASARTKPPGQRPNGPAAPPLTRTGELLRRGLWFARYSHGSSVGRVASRRQSSRQESLFVVALRLRRQAWASFTIPFGV
jgi:hypothetical protein